MSNYPDGMNANDIPGWSGQQECAGCEDSFNIDDLRQCKECLLDFCYDCWPEHLETLRRETENERE